MPVIAIGGSASVGKTTASDELARRLGIRTVLHVDDLTTDARRQPAAWLLDSLVESTLILHPSITAAIDALLHSGERAIIEGEGIIEAVVAE